MPFGLVNAPATFSRIMRKLLNRLQMLSNYLDDVLAHTKGWPEHLEGLRGFFHRVREAQFALRPTKCFIGYNELTFLRHFVGRQGVSPTETMVEKINWAPIPLTKKTITFVPWACWILPIIRSIFCGYCCAFDRSHEEGITEPVGVG